MIEIRKKRLTANNRYYKSKDQAYVSAKQYTLWVVVQNGKRIDSFLLKKNAIALTKRLKLEERQNETGVVEN